MSGFPKYVDLEFTTRCNLKCGFCFGPINDRYVPDLDFSFWRNVLVAIAQRGCVGIVISGGEPTLYPRLGDLLTLAKELGMKTVLSTHGRHEKQLVKIVALCDWIALPVDAATPDALRLMRGDSWGLDEAISLAGRLKFHTNGRLRTKLGTVATRVNRQNIVELARSLNSTPYLPFDTWKIYQYTPRRKFAKLRDIYDISNEAFHTLARDTRETGVCERINTVFSSHDQRRRAYLFVYPDGTLTVPNEGSDFSDIVMGNVVVDGEAVFDRIQNHELFSNDNNYETTYA